MRYVLISIVTLAVAATACGKGKDKDSDDKAATATEAAKPAPPPKPYEGPLTAERLKQAKDTTKPFQKWDEAYARLLGTVGAPTATEGTNHYWYLLVGDKCHELSVENANGEVGAVGLGEYDKIMKSKFDKCQPAAAEGEGEADAAGEGADEADEDDEANEGDEANED